MPHGKLGSDPATYAVPDQIESFQTQRVENFEIVKDDIFHGIDIRVFIGSGAAGVRRSDQAGTLGDSLMEGQPTIRYSMNVGEPVQVEDRLARAVIEHVHLATAYRDDARSHAALPSSCSIAASGNSFWKNPADALRNAGATCSAKSFMLFRAR